MGYQNKHVREIISESNKILKIHDDTFPITMISKYHFLWILISSIAEENLVINILLEIMSHLVLMVRRNCGWDASLLLIDVGNEYIIIQFVLEKLHASVKRQKIKLIFDGCWT